MRFYIFLLMPFFFFFDAHAWDKKICPNIVLKEGKIKLNSNEKVLICGSDKDYESWKNIPLTQSEFHLKSILQNLGYQNPRFEREGLILHVWSGPQDKIKSLVVNGADRVLRPEKKRKIVGFPLTPEKLNEVDSWSNFGVRSLGYACPALKVEAHAWDGTVLEVVELNGKKNFNDVDYGDLDGLSSDIMDRYQPFSKNDNYDIRKPQLMASRMMADGLFQSVFFVTDCQGNFADLQLKAAVGKAKIIRFGIGASTEELPFTDITFKNARLDNKASSFTAALHASPRLVSLTLGSELYWFPGWQRSFLGPRFRLAQQTENSFQTKTAKVGIDLGRYWDEWNTRFSAKWGPTINYVNTVRGVGPDNATYTTIEGSMVLMEHLYETSLRDQFEGWTASVFYRGQKKGIGSNIDANRYEVNFKQLWNLGGFAPPLFVLGTRIEGTTVDADELEAGQSQNLLPVEERIYLGGDQNLRGFPRLSINNEGLGFLSALYLGFELRLIEELPYHLQPFLLLDLARTGGRRYTLDSPNFSSYGAGLRWASPFGTLRFSAAHGQVDKVNTTATTYPEQWIYFLSFGQEF